MEKIFVTSKARLNNCCFIKLLYSRQISFTIVLEENDYKPYLSQFDVDYLVLPESNKGIAYARNAVKKHTERAGIKKYWLFDDDITALYTRNGQKLIPTPVEEVLRLVEEQVAKFADIGIASIEYRHLAWSATKEELFNSFCDVACLIDNELTKGLYCDETLSGKVDRDFAIQVIRSGMKTMRTTMYAFSAPSNGSNAGGLREMFYQIAGREKEQVDKMVEKWGSKICQPIVKPDGRQDLKIYWKEINSKQVELF